MIKATTSHGTYYLIDEDNRRAVRIPPQGREDMYPNTQGWFYYASYSGVEIGKKLFFTIVGDSAFDWQMSTPVVSIEEMTNIPGWWDDDDHWHRGIAVTHTMQHYPDNGPPFCKECTDADGNWVAWPCNGDES